MPWLLSSGRSIRPRRLDPGAQTLGLHGDQESWSFSKRGEFATISSQARLNSYEISAEEWVEKWLNEIAIRRMQTHSPSTGARKLGPPAEKDE